MTDQTDEFWNRAADAREELAEQYADDPTVILIDIGCPPEECGDGDEIVIRIHVTEEWFEENPAGGEALPAEVDGIPICVVRDDSAE